MDGVVAASSPTNAAQANRRCAGGTNREVRQRMMFDSSLRPSSLAIRGVASILFGIVAFAWPGITLAAVVLLYGVYALVDGVTALAIATKPEARSHRWLLVLDGLFGIGAGVVTLFMPGLTLLALILLIGARFLLMGVSQIMAAVHFRREIQGPWLYGLAGLAAIVFGGLTFFLPGVTAFVLVGIIGAYSLIFGATLLFLALRLRHTAHRLDLHGHAPT
jgi:uncharacterized membrane protein HdeD (DUF308 family)